MKIFGTYDPKISGGVIQNAHPVVDTYPWTPQRSVASMVQPHEKGNFFPQKTPSNPPKTTPSIPKGKGGQ